MAYFSEREGDLPAQTQDPPTPTFIEAVVHFLAGYCSAGWLARRWPMKCADPGGAIYATDEEAFWHEALKTLKFEAQDSSQLVNESNPVRVLNLLEFAARHVAKPFPGSVHDYYSHTHLLFHGPIGKEDFIKDVNDLFARFGLAFKMEPDCRIMRLTLPVLENILGVKFHTGEATLDDLLETAVEKFKNPDSNVRREALEKLWDAFERLKTLEPPHGVDKAVSAKALLNKAFLEPNMRVRAESEFKELTKFGNDFMIRHAEVGRIPITTNEDVDYLFQRMFAVIWRALKVTGRC